MGFLKQIKTEWKHLLKHKFISITAILFLLLSIIGPILGYAMEKYYESKWGDDNGYEEIMMETKVADTAVAVGNASTDIGVGNQNPFYYNIMNLTEDVPEVLEMSLVAKEISQENYNYAMELAEKSLEYYKQMGEVVTTYEDYRVELVHKGHEALFDSYVLGAKPADQEGFINAVQYVGWSENIKQILDLPIEEKVALQKEKDEFSNKIQEVIQQDDFIAYIDLMIESEYEEIEKLQKQIVVQEEAVVENPELEESASEEIQRLNNEIDMINEYRIPAWEYRKEHKINPSTSTWQEAAMHTVENSVYDLQSAQDVMDEKEFANDSYQMERYGTYQKYLDTMKLQEEKALSDLKIAQKSLETEKPDMKFVYDGSRNAVNRNLGYSLLIGFLAILVGGISMATEFQSGTIRLLMIRPRTRVKVYMSRFIAGLGLCLEVYIVGIILNVICNGMILGFNDFSYPNYSIDGEPINFWLVLVTRVLVCATTIIFAYAVAFAFSAIIRNAAVAIALPSVMVFGGIIATSIVAYTRYAKFLVYTPLPYLNMSQFYAEYSVIDELLRNGVKCTASMGVIILLILSILFTVIGLFSFKKRDITN